MSDVWNGSVVKQITGGKITARGFHKPTSEQKALMNPIEQKALALVNEVAEGVYYELDAFEAERRDVFKALCRAIEQNEAFKQDVSDAVMDAKFMIKTHWTEPKMDVLFSNRLDRFIILKPDPLVEVLEEIDIGVGWDEEKDYAKLIRAALEARGLEIREKG